MVSLQNLKKVDLTQGTANTLFPVEGQQRLALVTCGGAIETTKSGRRTYTDNVIALAIPVAPPT